MKHLRLALLLALTAAPLHAQTQSPQLTYVLKQMDTASQKFQRATADFRWDIYERVVRDTTSQTGNIYFERQGSTTSMGAMVFNLGSSQPDKVLDYNGGVLQMFDPGVDQITVLKAGSNQAQVEGFLTLGFGGSGTALNRAWNIKDLGPETLMDAHQEVKTERLDLTSKTGDKTFTHITIWIDPIRGVSLKQVFYAANGDTRTALYDNVKVNGNVHKDHFAIKKDKNTTTVYR
jgi:outer membrane lipoprotein-sorting protein